MIPNIIHFIFGLDSVRTQGEFSIINYIAIKSASLVNNPDKIYLYYKNEPRGEWWNRVKQEQLVETVFVSSPQKIDNHPLKHYAHKADILRLNILSNFGGVYLDIDTICLKPLLPLYDYDFVLGSIDNQRLCNAVMLSKKNNYFLKTLYNSYFYFRSNGKDNYFNEHSSYILKIVCDIFSESVRIEPKSSFYRFTSSENDFKSLFIESLNPTDSYLYHLWHSYNSEHLSNMTYEEIINVNTTYNKIARKFIEL